MLDAAEAHRNRHINHAPHGSGFGSLFVHVVNKTGTFLRKYDIVGLDGSAETQNVNEFRNRIIFRGVVPRKRHKGKFAVLQEDAMPEMVVRACVYGVTQARLRVESEDGQCTYCDIQEDVTDYLVSGGGIVESLLGSASVGIWIRQTILDGTQAREDIDGSLMFAYF